VLCSRYALPIVEFKVARRLATAGSSFGGQRATRARSLVGPVTETQRRRRATFNSTLQAVGFWATLRVAHSISIPTDTESSLARPNSLKLLSASGKTYRPHTASRRTGRRAAVASRAIVLLLALAVCCAAAPNRGKGGKRGKGGRKKQPTPTVSVSPGETGQNLTDIPLPIGHEAKGLTLPDFDTQGRLRGKFVAGSARRIDQDHIDFSDLKITTYTEDNQVDLQIDMHTSTFDLTTKILSSKEQTSVRRRDFNVIGDSATFDTNARTSRIVGNVKMVITDQSNLMEKPNP